MNALGNPAKGSRHVDVEVTGNADRILEVNPDIRSIKDAIFEQVVRAVFADPEIIQDFNGAEIRRTAMCAQTAQQILRILGHDPNSIKLMSIGDIDFPEFAIKMAFDIIKRANKLHLGLVRKYGFGYDLTAKGSIEAREAALQSFDTHYGFSEFRVLGDMINNSTVISGGMRGLDDTITALIREALLKDGVTKFMSPDNSFGTWNALLSLRTINADRAKSVKIPTYANEGHHLGIQNIENYYTEIQIADKDLSVWYITPVGNPSGTAMSPEQLKSVAESIVDKDPNAVIIMDSTYIRTLDAQAARQLLSGVMGNRKILDRVVFIDSLSKTHGLCGERIGLLFSSNPEIYKKIQNVIMTLSAGNGRQKDAIMIAATEPNKKRDKTLRRLHEFWRDERLGLFNFLIKSGEFNDLFEEEQPHITQEQINMTQGLYLFIKLKQGVTAEQILIKTGCSGVMVPMGIGETASTYMRFSVGMITEPTFAKYIPDKAEADPVGL